jgi:hypothetical protein
MPKDFREDEPGADEETDEEFEESDDEADDDFSEEGGSVDLDSDEILDDPEFEDDGEEELVSPRPTVKRRTTLKAGPLIEGYPRARLEKPDIAAEVWDRLQTKYGEGRRVAYALSANLKLHDVVDHKVFGVGFVIEITGPTKAEVLFREGLRKLVHSR